MQYTFVNELTSVWNATTGCSKLVVFVTTSGKELLLSTDAGGDGAG